MFCEVYLFDAPYHIDRPFDYSCDDTVAVGSIVRVPFGRADKLRLAVVVRLKETAEGSNIKPVHAVLDCRYSFSEEMLGLCLFLKTHTLCTFGEAAKCLIPQGALSEIPNVKIKKTCVLALSKEEAEELLSLSGRAGIRSEGQRSIIKYLLEIGSADAELVRDIPGVSSAHISARRA